MYNEKRYVGDSKYLFLTCFPTFCHSTIPSSCYISNTSLLLVISYSNRCMLEMKFAIYHFLYKQSNFNSPFMCHGWIWPSSTLRQSPWTSKRKEELIQMSRLLDVLMAGGGKAYDSNHTHFLTSFL